MNLFGGLNPSEVIEKIVDDKMCIGCGLCESIAGAERLSLELHSTGFEYPVVHKAVHKAVFITKQATLLAIPRWRPY